MLELYRVYTTRLGDDFGLAARPDFIAALAAMLGVMVFDTLPGLFIGIAVALILLLYRARKPHVATLGQVGDDGRFEDTERHPDARPVPGVTVLRIEGGIFFANAEAIRERVRAAAAGDDVHAVVIDAESIPSVDVEGARMLTGLAVSLEKEGVELAIARDLGQVRDVLTKVGREELVPRMYAGVRQAVSALVTRPR